MLLTIEDLHIRFQTPEGIVHAVNGLSFALARGRTLGIVGESGSGKTQLALAIMGLLADNGQASGRIIFDGQNLLELPRKRLNHYRGNRIGMIFQDPMTALNPYLRIEKQMIEVLIWHKGMSAQTARQEAIAMLDAVHIPDARNRIRHYPHEFSGGMRQRVMIAMALLCRPDLLIADEPTTALDVTVQAQIVRLLGELQHSFGMSILLITHDLGVIAGLSDSVMVMYAGQAFEQAPVHELFAQPTHPYTRGLLQSVPRLDQPRGEALYAIPGNPPNLLTSMPGCPFVARCQTRMPICKQHPPPRLQLNANHSYTCHHDASSQGGTA